MEQAKKILIKKQYIQASDSSKQEKKKTNISLPVEEPNTSDCNHTTSSLTESSQPGGILRLKWALFITSVF